jgi:methyl-accepting chemotaxis protein
MKLIERIQIQFNNVVGAMEKSETEVVNPLITHTLEL